MGLFFFQSLFCFLLSLIIVYFLMPSVIKFAFKHSIVDHPDGKLKKHIRVTPYLGGSLLYLVFLFTALFLRLNFYFITGVTTLVILGLIDDIYALNPLNKFIGQLVSSLFILISVLNCSGDAFFSSNCFIIVFKYLFILSLINAFNLVDIMDGLSSMLAIVSACTLLFVSVIYSEKSLSLLLFSLIGSLFGFLYYNKPLAKIYLGDMGSMFLGGALSFITLSLPLNNFLITPLFYMVPLLEVITLIIIRTYKNIPFYQGSPHHFAILLRNKGFSVKTILIYTLIISATFSICLISYILNIISFHTLLALLSVVFFVWLFSIFVKFEYIFKLTKLF